MCKLENSDVVGPIHVSQMEIDPYEYDIGTELKVKIIAYKEEHKKYNLIIVKD